MTQALGQWNVVVRPRFKGREPWVFNHISDLDMGLSNRFWSVECGCPTMVDVEECGCPTTFLTWRGVGTWLDIYGSRVGERCCSTTVPALSCGCPTMLRNVIRYPQFWGRGKRSCNGRSEVVEVKECGRSSIIHGPWVEECGCLTTFSR